MYVRVFVMMEGEIWVERRRWVSDERWDGRYGRKLLSC